MFLLKTSYCILALMGEVLDPYKNQVKKNKQTKLRLPICLITIIFCIIFCIICIIRIIFFQFNNLNHFRFGVRKIKCDYLNLTIKVVIDKFPHQPLTPTRHWSLSLREYKFACRSKEHIILRRMDTIVPLERKCTHDTLNFKLSFIRARNVCLALLYCNRAERHN